MFNINDLKIGVKLGLGFSVILLTTLIAFIMAIVSLNKADDNAQLVREESVPFLQAAGEMKSSIIEVQQWLTDVSATHNRDGYGDAKDAVEKFKEGHAKFVAMFKEENDTESIARMEELELAFDTLYATGEKMAEAYINGGLEAGNGVMEVFDADSGKLKEQMS
jgi:methyl-accepting chemotaxis protein